MPVYCTKCGKMVKRTPSTVRDLKTYMCRECYETYGKIVNQDWSHQHKLKDMAMLYKQKKSKNLI